MIATNHDGHSNENVKNKRQTYSHGVRYKFHQVGRHGLWPFIVEPHGKYAVRSRLASRPDCES